MRPNKIKKMMRDGEQIINGWLQIPSSFSAEVMSHQGWDSLTIDMQHGVIDYPNALQMLQSISSNLSKASFVSIIAIFKISSFAKSP